MQKLLTTFNGLWLTSWLFVGRFLSLLQLHMIFRTNRFTSEHNGRIIRLDEDTRVRGRAISLFYQSSIGLVDSHALLDFYSASDTCLKLYKVATKTVGEH